VNRFELTDSPHDRALVAQVHPPGWTNPRPAGRYHLVVVGAGTAGLVTAAGAAGLGARVALIERGLMGGDCLNVGCVPSKALLASAHAAAAARRSGELGVVRAGEARIDFGTAMERMRRLRAELAPNDSAARFRDLGVDLYLGEGRFRSPNELEVDGAVLRFRRAVIATGARPFVPPIPGLVEAGFRTHETIFNLERLPERLLVLGAGPIGCELAQAFARFGAGVTLVDVAERILPREDRAAAARIAAALERDGVELRLGTQLARVERSGERRRALLAAPGGEEALEVDDILVAVGRAPNVEGLGLEAAGVRFGSQGVEVDAYLRTSNRRILAAGDVASSWQFTHAADVAARTAIQNALFPFARKRAPLDCLPRVTYTDPELAQVGVSSEETAASGGSIVEVEVAFADVDRARLEGETEGSVRIFADAQGGAIRGATIVGRGAGDLLSEVSTAMAGRVALGALANVIHPYPTRAEALRKAGDVWNRRRLTPSAKAWLARYLRWIG
jgi:pyruvate/2-oxoglutarate dehydrogenase complex dihydrolipoamide dehydrogenase (E3) component